MLSAEDAQLHICSSSSSSSGMECFVSPLYTTASAAADHLLFITFSIHACAGRLAARVPFPLTAMSVCCALFCHVLVPRFI